MKVDKSERRERQRRKRKHGMRVTGRKVFTWQRLQVKRAETITTCDKKEESQ